MRFVSPLLKRAVYPALAKTGALRRIAPPGLAVVTYHGVLPPGYEPVDPAFDGNLVGPETLRRQLRLLKSKYNLVSPDEVLAWSKGHDLPERAVLITCDDGLLNHFTDMLPILQGEGIRCLFFVTGASAGQDRGTLWYEDLFLTLLGAPEGLFAFSNGGIHLGGKLGSNEQRRHLWWELVQQLSQFDGEKRSECIAGLMDELQWSKDFDANDLVFHRRFGLMVDDEVRQLSAAGMTIGAHTMSHPLLSKANSELGFAEIMESRARLQSVLDQPVWAFAYPFGDAQSVTPQVLAMPEEAGFEVAFLNYGGGLGTPLPRFALPRIHVTDAMSLSELEAHVSGFYAQLQRFANGVSKAA